MDKKRIALIIGFILITLLLGFGLYYIFFREAISPELSGAPTIEPTPSGVSLPSAEFGVPGEKKISEVPSPITGLPSASLVAQGGITLTTTLTQNPILSPNIAGEQVAYYDRTEGKFYRIDQNGKQSLVSNQTFYNVQQVTWGPQSDKAILQYPDGSKIFYDFNAQKQTTLPSHWTDFSFNPSGNKIAAKSIGTEPENRWLLVSNPDGTGSQATIPLGNNDNKVKVSWSPNNQIVGFASTGDARGINSKEIIPLGLHNENFKGIIVPGLDFDPLWSTSGDKLLFSTFNTESSYKPELWLVNAAGDSIGSGREPIKINTWAHKCTFSDNSTAYCAVPQSLPDGAGFEPEIANNTPDTLYKINLNTGTKSLIAIPDKEITINSILVSKDKDALYFTDASNGQLHKIKLK